MVTLYTINSHPFYVSEEDVKRVERHRWTLSAPRKVRGQVVHYIQCTAQAGAEGHQYLHRFILRAGPGDEVDHVSGNRDLNTRENLRFVTKAENAANSRRGRGRANPHYGAPVGNANAVTRGGVTRLPDTSDGKERWRAIVGDSSKKRENEVGIFRSQYNAECARDHVFRRKYSNIVCAELLFHPEVDMLPVPLLKGGPRGANRNSASGFKGVTKHESGKWRASVYNSLTQKFIALGMYAEAPFAARVHDVAARALHGASARPNFVDQSDEDHRVAGVLVDWVREKVKR